MKKKCDILSLEWGSGRDLNIVEPVLCYLEMKHNLTVVRESIWYGELKLLKYRPKALIISNSIGASYNYECIKFAHLLGIITIELVSEGNIMNLSTDDERLAMFWGWNKDRYPYSDLFLYWSESLKSLFAPSLDDSVLARIKISGATGFDRYKLFDFMSKSQFLGLYKKNYKKVIGIAAWGFDSLPDSNFSDHEKHDKQVHDDIYFYYKENLHYFIQTRDTLNEIYKSAISNNPDILFVLKYHPSLFSKELTEFSGLGKLKNTIEIVDEIPIDDVINSCDLWLAYESTTCIEAWLLGKQALYVDPEIFKPKRTVIYDGVNIVTNYDELQNQINSFYRCGTISGFEEKYDDRQKVIKDFISFGDGKNHKRAADYIIKVLNSGLSKQRIINDYVVVALLKSALRLTVYHTPLKFLFYQRVKKALAVERKYDVDNRKRLSEKYMMKLREFWIKQGERME